MRNTIVPTDLIFIDESPDQAQAQRKTGELQRHYTQRPGGTANGLNRINANSIALFAQVKAS